MKTIALWIIKRFLTPKKVAQLISQIIADLLRKASKSGKWDTYKKIIAVTEQVCKLFNECYEDDNMDKDDESKIASAIEGLAETIDIAGKLK